LASYQEKIFKIDDKIGMAIAGLTGDARIICKYMRNEALNYKSVYNSNHPLQRLIEKVMSSKLGFIIYLLLFFFQTKIRLNK
jgi:20S proteasome subunit alpha 6